MKYLMLLLLLTAPVYAAPPTVQVTEVLTPTEDTYIDQNNPTSTYGTNGNVMFGRISSKTVRGLFKFTIPTNTSIVSGNIVFDNVAGGSFTNWSGRVDARALGTTSWSESSTWNSAGSTTWPSTSAGTVSVSGQLALTDFSGNYALGFQTGQSGNLNVRSSESGSPDSPQLTLVYNRYAYAGDADKDGDFDSQDLVVVFIAGKYETGQAATWEQGDWNEDGVFNSSDLILALQGGHYEDGDVMADWEAL